MKHLFRRELAAYADAHRDRVNGLMHNIGNPIIFVAVVLPLCLVPVSLFGINTSAAPLLVVPALVLWTAWDVAIGLAIAAASVPLLLAAAAIASHVALAWLWVIAIGLFVVGWALQIIGHKFFEHNWPSLLDDPLHMLMSPMYVFAKLFIALGLRPDLAAILQNTSRPTSRKASLFPAESAADVGQTP
jgi:uncharacterized membrane protein YGL010W